MADVECAKCGTSFDTERETEHYGSPERCPYCGTEADVDKDSSTGTAKRVEVPAGSTVTVTIEVIPGQ